MKKIFMISILAIVAFGFNEKPAEDEFNTSEECIDVLDLACTSPNNARTPIFSTDFQNYLFASTNVLGGADGFEWTVTGGGAWIISGQGTNSISIGPNCPVPVTIEACVRAYNVDGASICYSAEVCNTIYYDGWCFI